MSTIGSGKSRQRQVFLSYAKGDQPIAREIADSLRKSGLSVWLDTWALKTGDSISSRIHEAVTSSDLLVPLLTSRSAKSKWVQAEWTAALSQELSSRAVTVIPVLIEDCELPPALEKLNVLDLRTDFQGGLQQLIQQLNLAPKIDFSALDWRSFENLVADLLTTLGFSVKRQSSSRDAGFDFRATYTTRDPFGAVKEEAWLVEVKLYTHQRVGVSALRQMLGYMTLAGWRRAVVVTNSQLTSVAQEFLQAASSRLGHELRVIGGTELTGAALPPLGGRSARPSPRRLGRRAAGR